MSLPFAHAFEWTRSHVDSGALPTAVLGVATASGVEVVAAFDATGARRAYVGYRRAADGYRRRA